MKRKYCVKFLLFFVFASGNLFATIDFGSKQSALRIAANTTLRIKPASLNITEGSIIRYDTTADIDGNNITFDNGIFENDGVESTLTAVYNPTGDYDIIQLGNNQKLRAEPGEIFASVVVSGNNSLIEGQPTFRQNIQLSDATTTLTLAIQSRLNKNIVLAGGTLQLGDDLKLDDDVKFTGGGVVQLHGKQLEFGGKDFSWDNDVMWDGARDMVINSRIDLTSTWTFYGENHIAGNGNILNFGTNGQLWVKKNSTLHLRDIKLRNLGSGSIVFEDRSSQVRFSDSQIEMDSDYTVSCGGIYVDGESTMYVKNWVLTFDTNGSLTVDGTCLWYDLLQQEDHVVDLDSIKPVEENDLHHRFIAYLNEGLIRRVTGEPLDGIIWEGVDYLHEDLWLSPDTTAIVVNDKVVFGRSHSIHFSRTDDAIYKPLIEIYAGKALHLLNVVLENFTPQHIQLKDADSSITFSHQTTIELPHDVDLNYTWSFVGDCVLRGKGHTLNLGTGGRIMLLKADTSRGMGHSALLFDDINIEGIGGSGAAGDNIVCCDNTGTLSFNKVVWSQDGNYTFTKGKFVILDELTMRGPSRIFAYNSSQVSTIAANAMMKWDTAFTFSYYPPSANRNLITMTDNTSMLYFNGASLYTTVTGLQLTKGVLIIDHKNYLYNVGATSISHGIIFGDGTPSNDLTLQVFPGGNIELMSGYLDYQDAN